MKNENQTNDQAQFDFEATLRFVEDAKSAQTMDKESVEQGKTLNDEELENIGIVKTSAYVRTRQSKNALRVRKSRDKKEEQGLRQLNVEVLDEHREDIKALVKSLEDGRTLAEAVKSVLADKDYSKTDKSSQNANQRQSEELSKNYDKIVKRVTEIQKKGGLRAFLLNRLI